MALTNYDWLRSFVLTVTPSGGSATHYVFEGCHVRVRAVPYVRGKEAVIELVNGQRIMAPRDNKYHVDVEVEFDNMTEDQYHALAELMRDVVVAASTTVFTFTPRANAGGTAPHGDYTGVAVIPELTRDQIGITFEDHIRERPFMLRLMGASLIAEADLPAWLTY